MPWSRGSNSSAYLLLFSHFPYSPQPIFFHRDNPGLKPSPEIVCCAVMTALTSQVYLLVHAFVWNTSFGFPLIIASFGFDDQSGRYENEIQPWIMSINDSQRRYLPCEPSSKISALLMIAFSLWWSLCRCLQQNVVKHRMSVSVLGFQNSCRYLIS